MFILVVVFENHFIPVILVCSFYVGKRGLLNIIMVEVKHIIYKQCVYSLQNTFGNPVTLKACKTWTCALGTVDQYLCPCLLVTKKKSTHNNMTQQKHRVKNTKIHSQNFLLIHITYMIFFYSFYLMSIISIFVAACHPAAQSKKTILFTSFWKSIYIKSMLCMKECKIKYYSEIALLLKSAKIHKNFAWYSVYTSQSYQYKTKLGHLRSSNKLFKGYIYSSSITYPLWGHTHTYVHIFNTHMTSKITLNFR